MELSKRLQAVVDLLDKKSTVADIGCDHGFVSIYLIENKKADKCIAMDVNQGPLKRAREHVFEKQLSTYIETRLSDGAKALQFLMNEKGEKQLEVDAALIAGMGGKLMIKIIQESLEKFKAMEEFVLQPQSEIASVRQFIRSIGCKIVEENIVFEDGKYYPMMKIQNGNSYVDNGENQVIFDEYGEYLLKQKNPVLLQYLEKEQKNYRDILEHLCSHRTDKSLKRQEEMKEKLDLIQRGLEWFTYEV